MAVKKELKELKEQSLAMEMIRDNKKINKRICISFTIILTVISILWACTVGYLIYVLNDIGTTKTTTTTQEISDVDTIENSNIANGDINGENKTK